MMAGAILGSAAIGAAGQAGLFGGKKQYGYSKGDIDAIAAERSAQIDRFSSDLASMRAQYLAQIPTLQTAAFNQFGNDAAANFGARGLPANSGAFQSALAKAAIPMTASMINTGYTTGVSNAMAVNSAYGQNSAARIGAASAGLSAPTENPMWAGLGQFAGQAGMMALYSRGQVPPGPGAAPFNNNSLPGNTGTVPPGTPRNAFGYQAWGS